MKKLAVILFLFMSSLIFSQTQKIYNFDVAISKDDKGNSSEPTLIKSRVFLYYSNLNEIKIYIDDNVVLFKIVGTIEGTNINNMPYIGYLLEFDGRKALFQIFTKDIVRLILDNGYSYELINYEN